MPTSVPFTIRTAEDTYDFLREYLPGFTNASIQTLESLYPVSDFSFNPYNNLSAEFFRSARLLRDILLTCQPIYFGQSMAARGNDAYFYNQNQTFLNPVWTTQGYPDIGVVHTSEMAYVFGNLSHYDVDGFPFQPNQSDIVLLEQESRSWSSYAATGKPSVADKNTLQNWNLAKTTSSSISIYVVGGPQEGLFAWSDSANAALNAQRLEERCGFLNSPEIIQQLNY